MINLGRVIGHRHADVCTRVVHGHLQAIDRHRKLRHACALSQGSIALRQHCAEAPCIEACNVRAIYKREDGAVIIDTDKCRGNKMCIAACPYENVIYWNDALNIAQNVAEQLRGRVSFRRAMKRSN